MVEAKKNERANALEEIELPSQRKFGFFFSAVFLIAAGYFLYIQSEIVGYSLTVLALLFLVTTLVNADLLLPLNYLWMRLGFLLGMIISPVVLGVVFFGLFTPYGVVMRIMGRDELRLKQTKNESHWVRRLDSSPQTDFKQQY